jgi:molecular chaperone DnaK
MKPAGLDLGTTNSVIAVWQRGRLETLKIEGSVLFPSMVYFKDKDTIYVGQQAKKMAMIDPEHTVCGIKRHMGDANYFVEIHGQRYNPVDISALILEGLVQKANKVLGDRITEAVITVPAYFTMEACDDTMKAAQRAGEKAGFTVSRLIKEPTAAAIAYGFDRQGDQHLLVYDLGGGTFDVSILEIKGNKYEVRATSGNMRLGGDDFDQRLILFFLERLKNQNLRQEWDKNPSQRSKEAAAAFQILKEHAEQTKCLLSEADVTTVNIPHLYAGQGLSDLRITRKEFEKLIGDLLESTKTSIDQALQGAARKRSEIKNVILVGGSTRLPLVKQLVTKMLREPFVADKVDEMVARGAALVAASRSAPQEEKLGLPQAEKMGVPDFLKQITIIERTAHTYGLSILSIDPVKKVLVEDSFSRIIPKGTAIPCKVEKRDYTNPGKGQSVLKFPLYRGEHDYCRYNEKVGEFTITGVPPMEPFTADIWVTLEIDENNILKAYAEEKKSRSSVAVTLDRV